MHLRRSLYFVSQPRRIQCGRDHWHSAFRSQGKAHQKRYQSTGNILVCILRYPLTVIAQVNVQRSANELEKMLALLEKDMLAMKMLATRTCRTKQL